MPAVALTIAGSDPSGGAGLQADLKTFHQHGVYGMSVVTLLTVQNTQAVQAVKVLDAEFVGQQLDAVLSDIPPRAAKTGALGDAAVIEAVAKRAEHFSFPLVVDPIMISKHGAPLLAHEAIERLKSRLLPHAFLVTPNIPEAERLTGRKIDDESAMRSTAEAIADLGAENVLLKGGHLKGPAVDFLLAGGQCHRFDAARIETPHTHGTGCVLSAAITARLALGHEIVDAVRRAKQFVSAAIRTNPGLGKGSGPLNLHASP